jgi:hypothetical protein
MRTIAETLHAALPNSQIVVLRGQQHVAMRTARELFVQEVVKFFTGAIETASRQLGGALPRAIKIAFATGFVGPETGHLRPHQGHELPWVRIDKEYRFETDEGSASLVDLFRGRSQLLVYHFMFGPDYTAGCPACSAIADGFDGFVVHLATTTSRFRRCRGRHSRS